MNDRFPKPSTMKAIKLEMAEARRHFPSNTNLLSSLIEFADELKFLFGEHDKRDLVSIRKISAAVVYTKAIQVAALACRLAEEGDAQHNYASYLK